jgi:hypothetical protein
MCRAAYLFLLSACSSSPPTSSSTVTPTARNLFADLELSVVQVFEEDLSGDDTLVFEGPDMRVTATTSFGFDRIVLSGTIRGQAISLATGRDARSPGRRLEAGSSTLHVQLVAADNDVARGPLLVFVDGAPLPCTQPLSDLDPRTAALPIHIVNPNVDATRIRHETRTRLNLSATLLAGQVTPGMPDAALFAERP